MSLQYNLKKLVDKERVSYYLPLLSDRTQDILSLYLGINHPYDWDCPAIAEKYGITKNRVYQIVNKGMRRVRWEMLRDEHLKEAHHV